MLHPLNLPDYDGGVILVTDELASPADYLLHKCLGDFLKGPASTSRHGLSALPGKDSNSQVVVVPVSEGLFRWKAIASRSNLNWDQMVGAGRIKIVEVSISFAPQVLKSLFESLVSMLDSSQDPPGQRVLVILDDISTFQWVGFESLDIQRFLRALKALCTKTKATLVIRHHLVSREDNHGDELFGFLTQICSYHIDVRALSSGRSGAVSGEIAVYAGPSTVIASQEMDLGVRLIQPGSALQYRLTDTGAVFFEKGTSGGVL
ncbi:hypothetical protein BDN72DRAFT_764866 [Pluteus cervinus]|uniref:Uncharacterized protein n=1 Tax=Pluteus cervinus TaxID=181527 RepID=A0ACD3B0E9_9AGAR|nr:hypothetical protein BDN72DRAFT_764866 [Pluteus cervinus]